MTVIDPSTADCLRMLLDDQTMRLREVAAAIAGAARHRMPDLPPTDWSGPARSAYDGLVERLRSELGDILRQLEEAAAHSARAAATLESRG